MVQNFKVTKNVIRVHRRGGGSGQDIDWKSTGLKSVVFQLFLRCVILPYFGQIWRCLLQHATSYLDISSHKRTKFGLRLLICIPDKPLAASDHL